MKTYLGVILLLLVQLKSTMCDLERELRISIDKAMQCHRRDPPKEPVIAMSPKRFSQLVGLLRHDIDPPVCDTGRHYPPFRLEDPSTWPFCVFGTCRNNKCQCFKSYSGPSCAEHSSRCWLMYCFLTSCHSSLQSFTCKCDSTLHGKRIMGGDFWYDEGKQNVFIPPPSGWRDDADLLKSAYKHPVKEIWVPLSKQDARGGRPSNANQRQQFHPQHGQSQVGRLPTNLQHSDQNSGQVQILSEGQSANAFQPQHNPQGGQIQGHVSNGQHGNTHQSQQHPSNIGQNSMGQANGPGSFQTKNNPEDSKEDIEEALGEMTEEPSSSISLLGKTYILCSAVLILNYTYQYILNI